METFATGEGHEAVAVAMDDAGATLIFGGSLENGQSEGRLEIASAEGDTVAKYKTIRRIKRIELDTEKVASGDVVAHRGSRCQQCHRLDVLRMVARYHRRHDCTLRVAHKRDIAHETQVLRVGKHLLQVLYFVRNGHLGESTVTLAVPVEIERQCGETVGPQLLVNAFHQFKIVVAVETMAQNHKVAPRFRLQVRGVKFGR